MNHSLLIAAAATVAVCSTATSAQERHFEIAPLTEVQVVTVKPDRAAEWEALQKEMNEAMRASDAPAREIWQVVTGNLDTYYILTPIDALGPRSYPMESDDLAAWMARVSECVQSRRSMVWNQEDLIPSVDGKQYEAIVLRRRVAKSGRAHDLGAWYAERLYPALREAGDEGRYVGRAMMGDSTDAYYSTKRLVTWETVNAPEPLEGMQNVRQLFADLEDTLAEVYQELLAYRADLSIRE